MPLPTVSMAMWRLAIAALIAIAGGDGPRGPAAARPTASAAAKDDPCSIPAAIFGHAPRQSPQAPRTSWERGLDPGCGRLEDLPLQPITLRMGKADLLRHTAACPNGFERLAPRPGRIPYYFIFLIPKGADSLAFEVTEGWVEYDANLKRINDVIAGCSTAAGTLSIRR